MDQLEETRAGVHAICAELGIVDPYCMQDERVWYEFTEEEMARLLAHREGASARLAAAQAQFRLLSKAQRAAIIAACFDNGAQLLAACLMGPSEETLERLTDE